MRKSNEIWEEAERRVLLTDRAVAALKDCLRTAHVFASLTDAPPGENVLQWVVDKQHEVEASWRAECREEVSRRTDDLRPPGYERLNR